MVTIIKNIYFKHVVVLLNYKSGVSDKIEHDKEIYSTKEWNLFHKSQKITWTCIVEERRKQWKKRLI